MPTVPRPFARWQCQQAGVTPPIQLVLAFALTRLMEITLGSKRRFRRLVVILVLFTVLVAVARFPVTELPTLPELPHLPPEFF